MSDQLQRIERLAQEGRDAAFAAKAHALDLKEDVHGIYETLHGTRTEPGKGMATKLELQGREIEQLGQAVADVVAAASNLRDRTDRVESEAKERDGKLAERLKPVEASTRTARKGIWAAVVGLLSAAGAWVWNALTLRGGGG